jgi:hypothetical protein
MMSNIASPWRYDTATFHARDPLEYAIVCELALRPGRLFSDVTVSLSRRALNHCRDRVNVRCRGKPGRTMLRLSISQFYPSRKSASKGTPQNARRAAAT